jgi:hypothetical protein
MPPACDLRWKSDDSPSVNSADLQRMLRLGAYLTRGSDFGKMKAEYALIVLPIKPLEYCS